MREYKLSDISELLKGRGVKKLDIDNGAGKQGKQRGKGTVASGGIHKRHAPLKLSLDLETLPYTMNT